MKLIHVLLMVMTITIVSSSLVRADAFDDKARSAAEAEQQAAQNKFYAKRYNEINRNNVMMVRRVPRNASIIECSDIRAVIYRSQCQSMTAWNGVPVRTCGNGYSFGYGDSNQNRTLPPEIVNCHYHLASGQDCEIVRNTSIRPRCY